MIITIVSLVLGKFLPVRLKICDSEVTIPPIETWKRIFRTFFVNNSNSFVKFGLLDVYSRFAPFVIRHEFPRVGLHESVFKRKDAIDKQSSHHKKRDNTTKGTFGLLLTLDGEVDGLAKLID